MILITGHRAAAVRRARRSAAILTILVVCGPSPHVATAQTSDVRRADVLSTTVPPESRLELIRAPDWVGLAFRVDKYLGRVSVIRRASDGSLRVHPIRPAEVGGAFPDRPNYQLFIDDAGTVFLVGLFSGALWQLTEEGPMSELLWRQILESTDRARALPH